MAHFTRLCILGIHVAECRVASWFQVKGRNIRCLYGCIVSTYHVISLRHKTSIYSKVWRNLKSKKWRDTCHFAATKKEICEWHWRVCITTKCSTYLLWGHCATSREVAGSISDLVIGIFHIYEGWSFNSGTDFFVSERVELYLYSPLGLRGLL